MKAIKDLDPNVDSVRLGPQILESTNIKGDKE